MQDAIAKDLDARRVAKESTIAKEFTTGCVTSPFPTTPSGPTYRGIYTRLGESADVTVWRIPCGAAQAEAQTLVTFAPRTAAPFICGVFVIVLQGGVQFDSISLDRGSSSSSDSLCSAILVPVTTRLRPSSQSGFDDDAAFSLLIASSGGPTLRIEVPAYNSALYGVSPPAFSIKPQMTGAWNTTGIGNQGWFFDINESGRTFAAAWFTGKPDGIGLDWYSALGTYSGDAVVTTLFRTTGVAFARATEVNTNAFGTLTFDFESCALGVVTWVMDDGRTGSLAIKKILPVPAGC